MFEKHDDAYLQRLRSHLLPLLDSAISRIEKDMVDFRRELHRNPELSFEEFQTCATITAGLRKAGIECESPIAGTGVRAIIRGRGQADGTRGTSKPSSTSATETGFARPVIYLRADIDALPIHEETGLPFASTKPGVMHACGHDAHTSIVLHTGMVLQALRDHWHGTVVLIFQPAEEKSPGGATALIQAGALSNPAPDLILGEHINPSLEAGYAGFRPGLMMASVDDFFIRIHGKGGHGATPHLTIDPIAVSAQVIVATQQLVSRMANPAIPTVLTWGQIRGEGSTNIIPPFVDIKGTFRTVDETWREQALKSIESMVSGVAAVYGARAEVRIQRGYPMVHNPPDLTKRLRQAAASLLGKDRITDLPLVMWAEDFAYYGSIAPACFYNLGVARTDLGWTSPLHSPTLMLDEAALPIGVRLMSYLVLSETASLGEHW